MNKNTEWVHPRDYMHEKLKHWHFPQGIRLALKREEKNLVLSCLSVTGGPFFAVEGRKESGVEWSWSGARGSENRRNSGWNAW